MITAHVFIAISLDGFIARADGSIDWLLQRDDPAEDHGYNEFIADKDVIVMGRGSYEKVMEMGEWLYDRPVLILSRRLEGAPVPDALQGKVRFSAATPKEALAGLAGEGVRKVYVDGGQVVQSFLRAGLVTDMVITTVPVLIGSGRSLFGELPHDIDLRVQSSQLFPSGLVQTTYRVAG